MENLYLISGDDEYEKNNYVEKLKENFGDLKKGINLIQIDKDNLYTLEQELSTYSFFNEPKLIIVKLQKKASDEDENKSKKEWLTEDLEDKILNKIETITLVFLEEGTSKGKLNKLISKNGKVIVFDKKKPQELATWAQEFAKEAGVSLNKAEAVYLVDLCGSNKQVLVNEIKKLVDYCEDHKITKADIDKMCIKTSEIIIFDLTDSYGKKDIKSTLKNLEDLIENKEPLQKILIMLTKHFKSLLLAKVILEQGKNVAAELGISPYPAKKYSDQSKNFSKDELIRIFKDLAQLDVDSKVGKIDLKIGLQKIIME
ncbi:MAG: DNA polymerase III subunit delta [Clostridia bacterium]|nr:DNA polymerase III subunit delta [Clostridia bacterium]